MITTLTLAAALTGQMLPLPPSAQASVAVQGRLPDPMRHVDVSPKVSYGPFMTLYTPSPYAPVRPGVSRDPWFTVHNQAVVDEMADSLPKPVRNGLRTDSLAYKRYGADGPPKSSRPR